MINMDIISVLLKIVALFLIVSTTVGFYRFDDFFSRTHFTGFVDVAGILLFILSFYIDGLEIRYFLKMIFLFIIFCITSTTSVYLVSKMAFVGGKK